ncbi:MAG TPA: hypothetical protein VJS37_15560, partial [Terriglobales bacterium]|nr:hypothetical protein [Terriglobales bacterium]
MPLAPEKLRILAFPQHIDGDQLKINALLLPTQNLLNSLTPFPSELNPGGSVDLPNFIAANFTLELKVLKGLSTYPFSAPGEGVVVDTLPTGAAFPPDLPALYEGLAAQFNIDTSVSGTTAGADAPRADSDGIRKYLPLSYRGAFNFTLPRTQFAKVDDSYHCAIQKSPRPDLTFKQSGDEVTWGRIIAFCLRQPLLAERMGLLYRLTLPLPSADYFQEGG